MAALALLTAKGLSQPTSAPGVSGYVVESQGVGRFALVTGRGSAALHVTTADHAGVVRAVQDLREDIGRVTGSQPALLIDVAPSAGVVVLVGTLGRSLLIDRLAREKKIDARVIAGKWETFLVQVVERPLPNVERALVIAGSDKRGTIYGVYDLAAQIGVSPWHWWADVAVRRRPNLFVLPGTHTQGEPSVRYRGIFINDEAPALSGWARATFGGLNHRFYERVFELLLRLKGNYLWPAMWGNAFAVDDTLNPRLADEYGVIMGTSHHEPMTRAHAEWQRIGSGPWDYEQNDSTLREFWRQGIARMGTREHIVTLGMRGDGDMPMTEGGGSNVALLERIVADQRRILGGATGKDAAATPQLWALYKEVQDYYDKGMRVPNDVTLLFADDNWGNIRRLPMPGSAPRAGGYGVYYHFDYVGGPRNYKWINTNPIARVWEQMHLAYGHGANTIWIVNVGDIKPMEFPTQFFLDYAWNPRRWPAERLSEYTQQWAAQQFGSTHAVDIADVLTRYGQYISRRKPELLDTATYSLANYREAESVVGEWRTLAARAGRLREVLPNEYHAAYYQLVVHPIVAAANLHDLYVTVAKNRLYARQGRAATNDLADSARRLFERDAAITRFYNDTLAGGKWRHMMDQTHIGYTSWQEPPRNTMPRVDVIHVPIPAEMGVAVEGAEPGRMRPPSGAREPVLPEFDVYRRPTHYVEIYNRGRTPFDYSIEVGVPWLHATPAKGRVEQEQRVMLSIDWERAPTGAHRIPVTIIAPNERRVVVQAVVRNPLSPKPSEIVGFIQGGGYVSIEAEHYSAAIAPAPLRWQRIPGFGRTLSGVTAMPVTSPPQTPGANTPRLEYRMFLVDSGGFEVKAYLSPTLNFRGSPYGLRYAISFDDEPPQIINMTADTSNATWERSVADNIRVMTSRHRLQRAGQHVLKFWLVDAGVVLQKLVIDAGRGGVRPSYLGPPESFRGDSR